MTQATLDRLQAKIRRLAELRAQRLTQYRDDPVAFAADCIRWPDDGFLTQGQQDILSALVEHRKVATRAPRGYGKTMPAAIAVLWFANTRDGSDWKIPTTAGSWLQLWKFLWPEIHKWAKLLDWSRLGRDPYDLRTELLTMRLSLSTGEAFAINSDDPDLLEGAHAAHILGIVDEAKAVPDPSWDATEGWYSSPGETLTLAQSVPGAPTGRFFDIHTRKPGYEDWHAIHITVDQALREGRLRGEWVEQRGRQWGTQSALYLNHVEAEFGGEEDGTIPLAWVEAAIDRWKAASEWDQETRLPAAGWGEQELTRLGVDVADGGANQTVIARIAGNTVVAIEAYMQDVDVAEKVKRIVKARGGVAVVDAIGVGSGVVKDLRKDRFTKATIGFVGSEKTKRRDQSGEFGFTNKRSAAWWNMREMLDPGNGHEVGLPDDGELIGDLTAPRWREVSGGRIQVEPKDQLVKRLGRSPDRGDSVCMGFWQEASSRVGLDLSGLKSGMLGPSGRSPVHIG